VDNIELPRSSCCADLIINNDNDDDTINAFVDDDLVVVSIDAPEPINFVGDDGTPFFVDAK
jgi:hypothetical protein